MQQIDCIARPEAPALRHVCTVAAACANNDNFCCHPAVRDAEGHELRDEEAAEEVYVLLDLGVTGSRSALHPGSAIELSVRRHSNLKRMLRCPLHELRRMTAPCLQACWACTRACTHV